MSRKTFVIDTNVLLHDPESIERFFGNDVVICLATLEELDKMKHFNDELGKNARSVIRYVDSIIKGEDLQKGIQLKMIFFCGSWSIQKMEEKRKVFL